MSTGMAIMQVCLGNHLTEIMWATSLPLPRLSRALPTYFSWPIDGCYVQDTLTVLHTHWVPTSVHSANSASMPPASTVSLSNSVHCSECSGGGSTPCPPHSLWQFRARQNFLFHSYLFPCSLLRHPTFLVSHLLPVANCKILGRKGGHVCFIFVIS